VEQQVKRPGDAQLVEPGQNGLGGALEVVERIQKSPSSSVIPAQAGIQPSIHVVQWHDSTPLGLNWIPACAGMTKLA
jgi:hypothetical protein